MDTIPHSALRHRTIGANHIVSPIAIRASKLPEPIYEHISIAHNQMPLWPWSFGGGMLLTLLVLLLGHLVRLPAV